MTPALILLCHALAVCTQAHIETARPEGCQLNFFSSESRVTEIPIVIEWSRIEAQLKSCREQRRPRS